jgi:YVTN family beta-propeller protein
MRIRDHKEQSMPQQRPQDMRRRMIWSSQVNTRRGIVSETINLGDGTRPMGTAMAPDGKHVYVSIGRSRTVLIVDTRTNRIVESSEAGPRPSGIGLSPDATTLYTANGPSNDMSVIDVASQRVTSRIPFGKSPWGYRHRPAD